MRKKLIVFTAAAVCILGLLITQRVFGLPELDLGMASSKEVNPGEVKTILELPEGDSPEGIALDRRGNIYVSNRRLEGETRVPEILRISPNGSVSVLADFPAITNASEETLLGLTTDMDGNVYAAFESSDHSLNGVWKVNSKGTKIRLTGSEEIDFPNALTFDQRGNLYVTDSTGSVWRFEPRGSIDLWAQHELIEPAEDDPFGFPVPGANGIAFFPPNHLYVANTEKGLLAHIPIQRDGSAGEVELVAQNPALLTIDGVTVDTKGDVYGVIPGYMLTGAHPLVKVDVRTSETTPIVTGEDQIAKFDVPLSVTFGRGARDKTSVFATNGDLPILPGGPGPGVVQVGVGVPGFP